MLTIHIEVDGVRYDHENARVAIIHWLGVAVSQKETANMRHSAIAVLEGLSEQFGMHWMATVELPWGQFFA